jgi:hypothetical protein
MDIIEKIAEKKIKEALEKGELDNLPGAGKPLSFDDESFVPEEQRLAYRVLKNAGCIPPELELRKEITGLRQLINTIDDDRERLKKIRELNYKLMKLNMTRKVPLNLDDFQAYERKIFEKALG